MDEIQTDSTVSTSSMSVNAGEWEVGNNVVCEVSSSEMDDGNESNFPGGHVSVTNIDHLETCIAQSEDGAAQKECETTAKECPSHYGSSMEIIDFSPRLIPSHSLHPKITDIQVPTNTGGGTTCIQTAEIAAISKFDINSTSITPEGNPGLQASDAIAVSIASLSQNDEAPGKDIPISETNTFDYNIGGGSDGTSVIDSKNTDEMQRGKCVEVVEYCSTSTDDICEEGMSEEGLDGEAGFVNAESGESDDIVREQDEDSRIQSTMISPFMCSLCFSAFQSIDSLWFHYEMHPQVGTNHFHACKDTEEAESAYTCSLCNNVFPSLCSLEKHMLEFEGTDFIYDSVRRLAKSKLGKVTTGESIKHTLSKMMGNSARDNKFCENVSSLDGSQGEENHSLEESPFSNKGSLSNSDAPNSENTVSDNHTLEVKAVQSSAEAEQNISDIKNFIESVNPAASLSYKELVQPESELQDRSIPIYKQDCTCRICGKQMKRGSLRAHILAHSEYRKAHKDAPLPSYLQDGYCEDCGKRMRKTSLLDHYRYHCKYRDTTANGSAWLKQTAESEMYANKVRKNNLNAHLPHTEFDDNSPSVDGSQQAGCQMFESDPISNEGTTSSDDVNNSEHTLPSDSAVKVEVAQSSTVEESSPSISDRGVNSGVPVPPAVARSSNKFAAKRGRKPKEDRTPAYKQDSACEICGKKMKKGSVRTHMLAHAEYRKEHRDAPVPFYLKDGACDFCGKRMRRISVLDHQRYHCKYVDRTASGRPWMKQNVKAKLYAKLARKKNLSTHTVMSRPESNGNSSALNGLKETESDLLEGNSLSDKETSSNDDGNSADYTMSGHTIVKVETAQSSAENEENCSSNSNGEMNDSKSVPPIVAQSNNKFKVKMGRKPKEDRTPFYKQDATCEFCGKKMKKGSLRTHMLAHAEYRKQHKDAPVPFYLKDGTCDVCGKRMRKISLLDHQRYHCKIKDPSASANPIENKNATCELCGKQMRKTSLKTHMMSHPEYRKANQDLPLPYHLQEAQCSICGKKLKKGSMLDHMRTTHSEERPYRCDKCGKTFKKKSHKKCDPNAVKYHCDVCGKDFLYIQSFQNHQKIHANDRAFQCPHCPLKFTTNQILTSHLKSHSGETPYQCTICGKAFKRPDGLTTHARIHAGIKNFGCTVCGKKFIFKDHLKRHEKIHLEVKPHICHVCGNGFTQTNHLRSHLRTHGIIIKPVKVRLSS